MSRHGIKQRMMAMVLSAIMVVGMMTVSTLAETGTFPIRTSGEVIAFEALGPDIVVQSVPLGTSQVDLNLPDTIMATIRLAVSEKVPVLNSGESDSEADSVDTISGSTITANETEDFEDSGEAIVSSSSDAENSEDSEEAIVASSSDAEDSEDSEETIVASSSDAEESRDSIEDTPLEDDVGSAEEITVPLPVTWTSLLEYNSETAGTYLFTPELPEGITLADGVEAPQIAITVSAAAIAGTVTAFAALPDDIRWQNTTAPEFPKTVSGTVAGETAEIPVTWEADHDYDAGHPVRGLYVFTAALGEGYGVADGIELPRMTVYISQTVSRMARMVRAGVGTSPLEITTAAQLAEIATLVNARESGLELFLFNNAEAQVTLELQNDIILSAYSDGEGWTPIGTVDHPFAGTFDGNDKSIIGLYINRNENFQGLFGHIGDNGTVKNLGVENVNITGHINVGSIAGWVRGTLQNCHSTGSVTGSSYVGGVAGEIDGGTLENCYNTGSVTCTGSGTSGSVGGVVGWASGTVQNCYNTGDVTYAGFGASAGGIAGRVRTGTVQNCFNTGSVAGTGSGDSVGGVAGWVDGTVQNCYNIGSITCTGTAIRASYIGGVVGTVNGTVQSCAALNSSISPRTYDKNGRVGGIDSRNRLSGNIAFAGMKIILDDIIITIDGGTDQVNGESKTAADIKAAGFFEDLFSNDTSWTYEEGKLPGFGAAIDMPEYIVDGSSSYFFGAGTGENPYQITTPAQLAKLAELVNEGDASYNAAYYKLTNDLDLSDYDTDYDSGKGFIPIGTFEKPFKGVFDGNGKTIMGLYIYRIEQKHIGIFGSIESGTVKNLVLLNVNVEGLSIVGSVTGSVYSNGTVQGCSSSGTIRGGDYIGSVVGFIHVGKVQNCYSTGSVTGEGPVGGVAGQNSFGTIQNCYSIGSVTGVSFVGGIVGSSQSSIQNCAALNPSVTATEYSAGRLAGYNDNTLSDNIAFDSMTVTLHDSTKTLVEGADQVDGEPKSVAEINAEGFFETLFGNDTTWTYEKGKLPGFGSAVDMPDYLIPAGANLFEGTGISEVDPYLIKTPADLAKLAELVNAGTSPYADAGKYYKLVNNLDLSGYGAGYDGGKGWIPIGIYTKNFKGIFDGGGKTIEGLYINRSAQSDIGLFGSIYGGTIKNLALQNVNIKGMNEVGGVAGAIRYDKSQSILQSCFVTGNISGAEKVGGIVGDVYTSTVQNCYTTANVASTGRNAGGVVGYGYIGTVQNCYTTANVTSTGDNIGGVVGYIYYCSLKSCVSLSPYISGSGNVGRIVGYSSSGFLGCNYAFSRISGTWKNKGLVKEDGEDVTIKTLFSGGFWTRTTNWGINLWDSTVWTFADDKLPTLTGIEGQSGEGRLYLKARDIQYATMSTAPLTYNGSVQIPAITFGGETLIEDTDYTVAITNYGTSAGTNAGTVALTITGIDRFYGTKNFTYTIGKKKVTITPAEGQSKKYGAADPVLTYTASPTLSGSDRFTGTLSRAVGENVGIYPISLGNLGAGANYELSLASDTVNFTIEQAKAQSITAIVDNINKTAYEMRSVTTAQAVIDSMGLPSSVSVITDGGTATLPITWETSTAYNVKGTEYAVTGILIGNENIDANGITKSVTVTVTPITASNPVFNDTLAAISSDSSTTAAELGSTVLPTSGSITVEDVSVAYTIDWNGGETLDRTAVGNEQTFTGVISYVSPPAWLTLPSDLRICRKVTVTAKTPITIGGITAANKTYDGTAYAPTGNVTCSHGFPINQLKWLYQSADGAGYSSSTPPISAGAYKLTIFVPESNADYAGSEMLTFAIKKRQIALIADNKTVKQGASLPQLTYTISNLPAGKTKTDALSSEPVLACPTFDGNMPGSYAIAITGGMAADNYTITTRMNGTLTVAEHAYTVTFNLNGGTRTGGGELTQTVAEGGAATAPTVSRSNYTFMGWDKPFDNVTANLTVTANWRYDGGGGGGSSGGDSNISEPSKAIAPTDKQPAMPASAKPNVPGTVKNGFLSAAITEQMTKDAIKAAQDAAKKSGKELVGIALDFHVTGTGSYTNLNVTIDAGAIDRLKEAGVKFITIGSSVLDITLDMGAISEIDKQSNGAVTLSAKKVTKLSAAAKKLIGNRPVFNITISCQKSGKIEYISSFGKGAVTLGIAYKATDRESKGNLFGVYVDQNGKPQLLTNSSYDNTGRLIFKRNSLSTYGVGCKAPAPVFTDTANNWAKDNIDFVVSRDLISGMSAATFAPDTAVTRATFLVALGKLSGADVSSYKTSSFIDVKSADTAMPYIEWAVKNKIVSGYGSGKLGPSDSITREQMAVMMFNYAKAIGYKLPVSKQANTFTDNAKISTYAKDAVKVIQQAGIISGKDNNRFDPQGNTTRAEAATILRRFVELVIDESSARGWVQNDVGQWQWIGENGKPTVGWLSVENGKYHYYFTAEGIMVSDKWLQIDGKYYYFCTDGSLAKSTKVDGYEVDETGARKMK